MKILEKTLILAAVMLTLGGCATSRSVVTLDQSAGGDSNPSQGSTVKFVNVKFVKVTDDRSFDPAPREPSTPSLAEADIANSALRFRAIGRKRNTYGKALGDVMLPEGVTVTKVVRDAVASGFSQAGYRVLKEGDAGFDQASPVELRINNYWSWVTVGALEGTFHCAAEVELAGPLPAIGGKAVAHGGASEGGWAGSWQTVASRGLKSLTQNTAAVLIGKPQEISNLQ